MHPEIFQIPFTHVTVKSYGLMLVIGFLLAVYIVKRLSRPFTPDPQLVTNGALYALIAGVVGARIFFIIHYPERFEGSILSLFAIWSGGLELLGGMVCAVGAVIFYTWYHKLPIRRFLDVLAIGMLVALAFGRIGCFLNGCCFGKPTNLPWAVHFPYDSYAYRSEVYPDLTRNRPNPYINLPADFFGYKDQSGAWIQDLKPVDKLTENQKYLVTKGPYRCLPVHPTELYESAGALVLLLILYNFRKTSLPVRGKKGGRKFSTQPGSTFALLLILYGIMRFLLEYLRDDNPFEVGHFTISQMLGAGMFVLGLVLMAILRAYGGRTAGERAAKS